MRRHGYVGLLLGLALLATACGGTGQSWGRIDGSAPVVTVKDALLGASAPGAAVRMEGTVATQCASSGCWLFLQDGTGRIMVDLKALGLGLPPSQGRKATVGGVLESREGQLVVAARGLRIGG